MARIITKEGEKPFSVKSRNSQNKGRTCQKQLSVGVLIKRTSENMQQTDRGTACQGKAK